jgi:8-oxo-dGTP pyrophosphatase MutT (NUDIX family)
MPISPYIRQLRAQVGSMRLLLPSVSVHVFDSRGRLLLVQQRESGVWSTPGGLIEPDESPADAAAREVWEETGLLVRPDALLGVYGGPSCVVQYPSGDEVQYVITAFGCSVIGGTLRPDDDETSALHYWAQEEAAQLHLAPWLRTHLAMVYAGQDGSGFIPPAWTSPSGEGAGIRSPESG